MSALDRRDVLAGGLSLVSTAALAHTVRAGDGGSEGKKKLVLVQLSGGNDGLSTVVPYADDAYHASRPTTAHAPDEVLRLDDRVGLHPDLANLHRLFESGDLAVVQGVGYPHPNRSHFKSMDIWHTCREEGRGSGSGWIGRLVDSVFTSEASPELVVHVGANVPYALHSFEHPATAFANPAAYRWVGDEHQLAAYERMAEQESDDDVLEELRRVQQGARVSSLRVRRAAASYRPRASYPTDALGDALQTVAALVEARLATRVFSVELTGFDTHSNQKARHATLMRRLDAALGAFLDDLREGSAADEVVVLVYSEFGRRVAENGSKGTDHGTAGPVLVAGTAVRGGVHGRHPSLTELDAGDLVHTTDFRSVYATLIERWFDARAAEIVGGEYPLLELV